MIIVDDDSSYLFLFLLLFHELLDNDNQERLVDGNLSVLSLDNIER